MNNLKYIIKLKYKNSYKIQKSLFNNNILWIDDTKEFISCYRDKFDDDYIYFYVYKRNKKLYFTFSDVCTNDDIMISANKFMRKEKLERLIKIK